MKCLAVLVAFVLTLLVVQESSALPPFVNDGYWFASEKRGPAPEEAYRELEAMFGNMQRPRYDNHVHFVFHEAPIKNFLIFNFC